VFLGGLRQSGWLRQFQHGASNRIASVVTPYRLMWCRAILCRRSRRSTCARHEPPAGRDILGTPLLTSVFHADRWDYVFTFKRQGVEDRRRASVTVFFKGDVAGAFRGRPLPTEAEFVASLDSGRKGKYRCWK
jgi:outer membrane protein assembly factor BamE